MVESAWLHGGIGYMVGSVELHGGSIGLHGRVFGYILGVLDYMIIDGSIRLHHGVCYVTCWKMLSYMMGVLGYMMGVLSYMMQSVGYMVGFWST